MPLRWPFRLALVLVILAAPMAWATPAIANWWHDRAEAKKESAELAKFERQTGPAMAALAKVVLPSQFRDCAAVKPPTHELFRCWKSDVDPREAAADLREGLAAVGASALSIRCSPVHSSYHCH